MKASVRDLSELIIAYRSGRGWCWYNKASLRRLERLGLLVSQKEDPNCARITAGGRAVVERLARHIPEACALEGVEVPE